MFLPPRAHRLLPSLILRIRDATANRAETVVLNLGWSKRVAGDVAVLMDKIILRLPGPT
jgi:hypothetical protein